MTEAEIQLIQSTYSQIKATSTRMASFFYNRLSELDASLESIFEEDRQNHGIAFSLLLGKAVDLLNNPEEMLAELSVHKAAWIKFKRSDEAINTIGSSFIDTLSFAFGNEFKPAVLNAWANGFKTYASLFSGLKL